MIKMLSELSLFLFVYENLEQLFKIDFRASLDILFLFFQDNFVDLIAQEPNSEQIRIKIPEEIRNKNYFPLEKIPQAQKPFFIAQ